jgi:uncharacterized protein YndB with AHSA1/START domain
MSQTEVRVSRSYEAPAGDVFDAFLDARKIAVWFAPGLGEMVRIQVDARIGGEFSIVQRRDGVEVDHTGEYLEMLRPLRLAFTWSVPLYSKDADIITIDLVEADGRTEVTLIHELHPDWRDQVPQVAQSWNRMLLALELAL